MNSICVRALGMAAFFTAAAGIIAPQAAHSQQTYRNIINQRFRTVSNGPQSAIIVDVKDPNDLEAVRQAVSAKVRATRAARTRALSRGRLVLPGRRGKKGGEVLTYVDTVLLRQNGKLLVPGREAVHRDVPAGNALTINIPTSGTGAFAPSDIKYQQLSNLKTVLYNELVSLLGRPFASGTVNILDIDDDAGNLTAASTIRGVTLVPTNLTDANNITVEIHLPRFNSDAGNFQDTFLGLTQALAQAFHLPAVTYDAFEQGMARAAASIAVQELTRSGQTIGGIDLRAIDPVPGFFYTPYYDLQNQPALGNNTFFPPTSVKLNFNQFATMIAPRLQMAGTAWTKCYVENPAFFKTFNNAYYNAYKADPTTPNNVTALRAAAAAAVPTVEGLPFDQWFEQQYILDTSITPGPKIYAFASPSAPDQDVGAGAGIGVYYYVTNKTGDEATLNATLTPTYFDHAYNALPSLDNTHPTEPITNGAGTTVPLFTGIGDTGTGEDKQRIAVDLLVSSSQPNTAQPGGNEYVRLYFPANEETFNNTPTDFSGVVVGAQSGDFVVTFNGGGGPLVSSANGGGGVNGTGFGAFNGVDPGSRIPTGFTKATINFTPTNGTTINFQRNVFVRKDDTANSIFSVAPIFVLNTGLGDVATAKLKAHSFSPGPHMIALPLQPYQSYTSNLPLLFTKGIASPDPNASLIAQYRQDGDANVGKYLRYPSLLPYQPGLGFWTNFASPIINPDLSTAGQGTDNKDLITVPLQFGWNMIGNPYSTDLPFDPASTANGGIFVQYLNGDPLPLQEAVNTGLVAAGVFGYNGNTNAYQDITQAVAGGLPQNTLQAWNGYWLRVQVTEGVTLSYFNPVPASTLGGGRSLRAGARIKRSRANSALMNEVGGWRLPLVVRDTAGNASGATLGQSPRGGDSFVPALDASSPPAPLGNSPALSVRFPHSDWDTGKAASGVGEFLSDVRRSGASAQWDMIVHTPLSEQPYVLTWNKTAQLPRGTRLTLIDLETNTRHAMNTSTSYTFTPARGVTTRRFQVKVEPRLAGRLFISNSHVEARLSRGVAAAATISYEVSGAGEATIQITTASGRPIRHILRSRAVTSGVNQAVWDYKDDQGRTLSTGTYLISITAITSEGETARVIVPHVITR